MFSLRALRCQWILTVAVVGVIPFSALAQEASMEVPTRDQIPDRYKWDLSVIYSDTDAWRADFDRAQAICDKLSKQTGSLGKSAQDLLETLQLRDEGNRLVGRLAVYAHQSSHLDTANNDALALAGQATTLGVKYEQAVSWIEPELLALPEETLRSWCTPGSKLGLYKHYFDDVIRNKAHTLSAREEELIAMTGNMAATPGNAYTVLNNAELDWPTVTDEDGRKVTLSHGRYNKFIRSTNREVRKETFFAQMETYKKVQNTIAALLTGTVQGHIFEARARGFDSSLEAALFPSNIPVSVFRNLVSATHDRLDVLHRWGRLRKEFSGVSELHVYDLYQPLVADVAKEIEYDDAVEMVINSLPILGDEYTQVMKTGFNSRWIDVFETKGKRAGGYSWGAYDTNPFILLNYNKTLSEVSTITHEIGHSMHSFLTHKNQPIIYGDYATFVAEVASTFNEILLQDYMLNNTEDPRERAYLLEHAINQIRGTVHRQTMFAEFELAIHEAAERGEALTADSMGKIYLDLFHTYWGAELVRDPEHSSYWARIPHFHRNFYVYQYSTSLCAASALAKDVLGKKPGAVERYLTFLSSGSSLYPIDALKRAGVDMTTPAPIIATMERFDKLITEFEKLMRSPSS